MPVELSVDQQALQSLARALSAEADGKKLRRELAKKLREALEPAKQDIRAELMGMGVRRHGNPPLRTNVLKNMKAQARLSGRRTGARISIKKTPDIRGFANAPKRLNRKKGWRHPVFGDREHWVAQIGKPEYFDRPLHENRDQYRKAVLAAMEEMAQRIAKRVR